MLEPNKTNRPTHIAIYHLQNGNSHQFQIRLGHEGKFKDRHPSTMSRPDFALDRIHVEPIPEEIMNLVSDWLDAHGPFKYKEDAQDPHHRYMGSLGFTVENEKATTAFKFPKSSSEDAHAIILRNGAPRWGSHLEALCVKHLEDKGVRFISSGNHPSEDVIQVLEKAGLSAYKDFQIKEWYEKLEAFYQNRRTR